MTASFDEMRVVTHQNWIADYFADVADFPVRQDFGFDINPDTANRTLWWAPGEWVARATQTGVRLPLMSCRPWWTSQLPYRFTDRWNIASQIKDLKRDPKIPVFAKLAEVKTDRLPATDYANTADFIDAAYAAGATGESWANLSEIAHFETEARFFVAHDRITAGCVYMHRGKSWDSGEMDVDRITLYWLQAFANEVLESRRVTRPPGFVIDVGYGFDNDTCMVIEANASWSSSPYGCDPAGVLESVIAAHDFAGVHPQWAWHVDAIHANVRPLRVIGQAA